MEPSCIIDNGHVEGVSSVTSCLTNGTDIGSLQTHIHGAEDQQHHSGQPHQQQFPQQYDQAVNHGQQNIDDFFEQVLLMPWELNAPNNSAHSNGQKLFTMSLLPEQATDNGDNLHYSYLDSAVLGSRIRQQQGEINKSHFHTGILPNNASDSNLGGFITQFSDSTPGLRPPGPNLQKHVNDQMRGYEGIDPSLHPNLPQPAVSGAPPARPRVRARRGQATDPHSIAERLRRERIAERMKALQELVPNSNKTDKASMLDEIIDYVKFLQLQVKVLSVSRLGGAGAVAPLVAGLSSTGQQEVSRSNQSCSPDSLALSERQVAKLMEEDMGTAMQYLQGKGLCLMPISLATAISSTNTKQSPQQVSRLQNLLASSNATEKPLAEPANSSLSGITSISSSTEAENKQTANRMGSASTVLKNEVTGDEESQSHRNRPGQ
eukprot:TRINITY_DN1913_c0_g1_i1.p1 TRINITY_DN1913_c0_g1~~TRINITY_DN1913_c0_g1_i1.p1  ORF type:complete len:434 (-),score=36.37 TRINITY_DN1913_c0_g1_i1:215-1516(-)